MSEGSKKKTSENKDVVKVKNNVSKKKSQAKSTVKSSPIVKREKKTNGNTYKNKNSQVKKKNIQTNTSLNNKNQLKMDTELVKSTLSKKKKLNIILDVIITIIIITIIVLSILLYFKKKEENKTRQELIEAVIPRKISSEEMPVDEASLKNEIEELRIKYNNEDVYGILSIANQDTSIPLVKGDDNNYYLSHSISKENSIIGSVFIDYRHDSSSRQINIYGHNSGNYDPPLRVLENYLFSEKYFNNNLNIELKVDNEVRKYQIFSIYPADNESKEEHMQFDYQSELDWLRHFERMHQRSLYKTNVVFSESDNILVLQTCILYGKYQDKLLIVAAKEIK